MATAGRASEIVRCVFCGQRGPRSQEHAWEEWIANEFPVRARVLEVFAGTDRKVYAKPKMAFSTRLKDVCLTCNGKWIRDIGEAARPVVKPMIFGAMSTKLELTVEDRVGAWAYLRMLVLTAAANPERPLDFPPTYFYRQLAETHRPPAGLNCQIWLATMQTLDLASAYFSSGNLHGHLPLGGVVRIGSGAGETVRPEAYIGSFQVGHLVARLFLYTSLSGGSIEYRPVHHPAYGEFLIPIWPIGYALNWPPAKSFDPAGYVSFTQYVPIMGHLKRP